MILKTVFDFLDSPLVAWAKSVLSLNDSDLNYENFPNGEYFYLILKQTDPRLQNSNLPNEGVPYDTTRSRLLNLDFILRNTRSFYQDILNHVLLIKLPDIYQIAKYPESDETFKEMEKMLLLLLGIAINGEFKESFIEQIQQQLETQIQINLIPYIQLVTEDINFSVSKSILLKIDPTEKNPTPKQPSTTVKTTLTLEVNANPNIQMTPSSSTLDSSPNAELNNCESNLSMQSNSSSTSSTTSFANNCQQLNNMVSNSNDSSSSNQLILSYSNLDQLNYFLNTKIMQNVQRIVDERDSYLESIIELQQDKDYLSFKLNSCLAMNTNCNSSSINEATLKQLNSIINNSNTNNSNINNPNSNNVNLNSPNENAKMNSNNNFCNNNNSSNSNLVDLVVTGGGINSVGVKNNISNCCNVMNETSLINSSSLIELSEPQALLVLIESIYKEIASANTIIESASFKNSSEHLMSGGVSENSNGDMTASGDCQMSNHGSLINLAEKLNALNIENANNSNSALLNDLKSRKLLANNWNQKIAIELVECKVKLRQLINEIEEKCEQIETLRDEIDDVKKQVNKLRNENVDLQQKAALANVYSDELESLREKSTKVDKYESELSKLKERMEEYEANNLRLEELKDENSILIETRSFMEKQLNDYQVRLLGMQRVDVDLNKYKQDIEDLLTQRELDKKRLCELCEKNAKFELEMKNLLNQNVNLDEELNYYKQKFTFTSAELNKQQQQMSQEQKTANSQVNQINESNKIKLYEAELKLDELTQQMKLRDQELSKLKENFRLKEINSDECLAKVKVLSEQLNIELENKMRYEKTLDQHKLEIKDLQLKLDDCVIETKKLDHSIRVAAESNEQKEIENRENFKKLIDSHDQLNNSYKKLLNDHEQLQKIYIQLENDYDDLYKELNQRHTQANTLNQELDELKGQHVANLLIIEKLEEKCDVLSAPKDLKDICVNTDEDIEYLTSKKQREIEEFYEQKFQQLNNEISELKQKREKVESKVSELSKNLEANSEENVLLKSENKNFQLEISMNKDKIQLQFMQLNQMTEKVKSLETLNEKLEDEKAQLYEQLHLLLQQNQEILTQTLASKDMYHEETKAYLNQLNNLKRQKEMLEQKIMEQYKNCPSLSSKQKAKKSIGGGNLGSASNGSICSSNGQGLIRQLVQKVRNKSSSTSSHSSSSSACSSSSSSSVTPNQLINPNEINVLCNAPQTLNNLNDLTDHDSETNHINLQKSHSFCHKYSADDINHLNIDPKEIINSPTNPPNTMSNKMSCLSSSSTTSSASSSSSSSSCVPVNISIDPSSSSSHKSSLITPTKQQHQQVTYIINNSSQKIDPKSLKLGGRPQSICSSLSSSPVPQLTHSPSSRIVLNSKHNNTQIVQNDFKRALFTTSSPKCPLPNAPPPKSSSNNNNQSPTSSSTSSSSSCLSSSSSSTSLAYTQQQQIKCILTPQKMPEQHPTTVITTTTSNSPLTIITKKNNANSSIQLLSNKSNNRKPQKIAERLADSLSKLRVSSELDAKYNELNIANHFNNGLEEEEEDDEDEEDEDSDDGIQAFANLKQHEKTLLKTASRNLNTNTNANGGVNHNSKNSNEIWLEYGCI